MGYYYIGNEDAEMPREPKNFGSESFKSDFDRNNNHSPLSPAPRFVRKVLGMPDFGQALRDVLGLKKLGVEEREAVLDVLHRLAKVHPHIAPSVLGAEFKTVLHKEGISVY